MASSESLVYGEHTSEILLELGFADLEINELSAKGAVHVAARTRR